MKRTGIKTLRDVRERCRINEAGCWIWAGMVSCGSARATFARKQRTMAGVLYEIKHKGEKVPLGMRYHAHCGDNLCMLHRKLVTLSEACLATPPADPIARRLKIVATKRPTLTIPQKVVDAIRAAGKGNIHKTAREHGVNVGTARGIASGHKRAPISSSSVFAWRP
jgi:hypothetical protein